MSAAEKEPNQLKSSLVLGLQEVVLFSFKEVNQRVRIHLHNTCKLKIYGLEIKDVSAL